MTNTYMPKLTDAAMHHAKWHATVQDLKRKGYQIPDDLANELWLRIGNSDSPARAMGEAKARLLKCPKTVLSDREESFAAEVSDALPGADPSAIRAALAITRKR